MYTLKRAACASGLLFILGGCESMSPGGGSAPDLEGRLATVEAQISDLEKAQQIQSDINNALLTNTLQPKEAAPEAEPVPARREARPPAGYSSADAALAGGEPFPDTSQPPAGQASGLIIPKFAGTASLHLGSFSDAANLAPAWDGMQKKYPTILGGLRVLVEYVTLANGSPFLRMKAGPFPSVAEAAGSCQALLDAGEYCAIQPFTGDTIDTFIID